MKTIFLGIILLIAASQAFAEDTFPDFNIIAPKTRIAAPSFNLENLMGETESLEKYRGKVVLIHFWATWCHSCKNEMPILEKIMKKYEKDGLKLLTVNVDLKSKDYAIGFNKDMKTSYPVILDITGQLRKKYEITALPMSYIIGRDGKFIGKVIGQNQWDSPEGQKYFKKLLTKAH